jgi:hypothetical protein
MEPRTCAARKDSAVHVSLSSYSPFKQPGASHPLSLDAPESLRSSCHRPKSVTNHRKSEELRGHAFPPSGGAPCVGYICSTAWYCQPRILEFFIRSSSTAHMAVQLRHRMAARSRRPSFPGLEFNPRSEFSGLGEDPRRRRVTRPAAPHSSHNRAASCRWGNTGHVVPASLHDRRNIRPRNIRPTQRKYRGEVGRWLCVRRRPGV